MRPFSQLSFATVLLISPAVFAASGTVQVTVRYYEWHTSYCKANQTPAADCTGSKYNEAQYKSVQPLERVLVQLVRVSDGVVLGQSTTNSSGVAAMSWSTGLSAAPLARFLVSFSGAGGVFRVTDRNDVLWNGYGSSFQLSSTSSILKPQVAGAVTFGSTILGSAPANIYAAAEKWWDLASTSSLVTSRIGSVPLRYDSTANYYTLTYIDNASVWVTVATDESNRLETIIHELGHVVFNKGGRLTPGPNSYEDLDYSCTAADGCIDPLEIDGGHYFLSAEFRSVGFEEGYADWIVAAALFEDTAPQPIVCFVRVGAGYYYCQTSEFGDDAWDFEASTPSASCVAGEDRWEVSVARYLWDVTDSREVNLSFADTVAIFNTYYQPGGNGDAFGDHGALEPWNNSGALDNKDGRSATDFYYHARYSWSGMVNTSAQRAANCNP